MTYNYYQVVQAGGDEAEFKSKLITHWNADKSDYYTDLRYPGGQRAFHTLPTEAPYNQNLSGYAVSSSGYTGGDVEVVEPPDFKPGGEFNASRVLGFSTKKLLDYGIANRKAEAARIAGDPAALAKQMETVLDALSFNNPVIFYSGFSMDQDEPIHLILLVGFAYLRDDAGRDLWLVVADPATHGNKISAGMFIPPMPQAEDDLKGLSQLSSKHDLIRVIPGNWENAEAALVLIRARKLFEENTQSRISDDLYMDYQSKESQSNKGGTFLYSLKATPVPPGFVVSSIARVVSYPFDTRKERIRPVNYYALTEQSSAGRFPFGNLRNLHSGVHLDASTFTQAKPQEPAPKPSTGQKKPESQTTAPPPQQPNAEGQPEADAQAPGKGVRCLAPGYIVALRLANAYPSAPKKEGAAPAKDGKQERKDLQSNTLSRELSGNHNSFVLVRHDLEEVVPKTAGEKGKPQQKGKRFTFYSLYMHLAPPDWSKPNTYRDVSWHKTLARRNGCLAVIDPQHESFRQVRWLKDLPAGQSLSDKAKLVSLEMGSYLVIGAGVGLPQPLSLGETAGERIRAVWKKPDQDLDEIYKALEEAKVVTFSRPYLKVEAGELIGYIDEKNELLGDGFVHWEVLAPSGSEQIQQLLEFADGKLQLSEGSEKFFKFFEEKNEQNNYFDPLAGSQDGGELATLLDLAPTSKHVREPEKQHLARFRNSYDPELLQSLLGSTWALPFSKDDQPSSEPGYVAKLLLENYKNCLPEGPYKLKVTFEPKDCGELTVDYDGRKDSIDVVLPARARKIFVEPVLEGKSRDFFLQTGTDSGKDGLRKDVEHFKKLASVRWRNVVLRHLNDWSRAGISAQLEARLEAEGMVSLGYTDLYAKDKKGAKKAIDEYASAVAWWAHEENAFLGSAAEKKNLFAGKGSAPEEGQLPEETTLDNPHPVTWAWLLMLLTRHGFARFADMPLWRSDDMKKVGALGWLPARNSHPPQRVGEHVQVVALQRGNGDELVSVKVKRGALSLDLVRGFFKDGMFIESVPMPGWGQWLLEKPNDAESLGTLEMQGLEPVLLWARSASGQGKGSATTHEVPVPVVRKRKGKSKDKDKDGWLSWVIPFRENRPKLLRGWMLIRYWTGRADAEAPTEVSEFKEAGLAIPIEAREDLTLEAAGFEVADGFIKKGTIKSPKTYVTQHFTYNAFLDAAKGQKGAAGSEPLLAWELAEAVERIQCAYSPLVPLSLSALSADGLSLQLKAATKNVDSLRKAMERVKEEGWLADFQEEGKGAFRVSVNAPKPGGLSGELVVEFNPDSAFAELKKSLSPGNKIAVMFGCLFPNGGGALNDRLLPTDTTGKHHVVLKADDLRSEAKEGYLELWSTEVSQILRRPGFDVPVITLTEKGALISVKLLGAPESFWRAVNPTIKIGKTALDKDAKVRFRSDADSLSITRLVSLDDANVKGSTLAIRAEARTKQVPLEGEKIDVADSARTSYDAQPGAELEVTPKGDGSYGVVITVKTKAIPISRGFKIEIVDPRVPPNPKKPDASLVKLPKNCIKYTQQAKKEGVVYGVTDAYGVFSAELDEGDLKAGLNGGIKYTLRVIAVYPQDKSLNLEKPCTLHEDLQARESEDDGSPDMAATGTGR
ncbi:MAG: hypothetical protein ACJ8AT_38605 [Hyalangium sp.]|uniref:hypothetical protein n=1 Tax=Hyalangium sp. TaxID=2028555 RepID=UPI00389AC147